MRLGSVQTVCDWLDEVMFCLGLPDYSGLFNVGVLFHFTCCDTLHNEASNVKCENKKKFGTCMTN